MICKKCGLIEVPDEEKFCVICAEIAAEHLVSLGLAKRKQDEAGFNIYYMDDECLEKRMLLTLGAGD